MHAMRIPCNHKVRINKPHLLLILLIRPNGICLCLPVWVPAHKNILGIHSFWPELLQQRNIRQIKEEYRRSNKFLCPGAVRKLLLILCQSVNVVITAYWRLACLSGVVLNLWTSVMCNGGQSMLWRQPVDCSDDSQLTVVMAANWL